MIRTMIRSLGIAAIAAASITLAGCQGGGHTRGMFSGNVIGKTEAEIIEKYGKPATVERANPEKPVLVYREKTFDPDNENKTDPETVVFLAKDKDGRLVANDVSFRG